MGYRQLIKKYMQELQLLAGTDYVLALSLCNGLDSRELGELKSICAELEREMKRDSSSQEEAADYSTIAEAILEANSLDRSAFIAHCHQQLAHCEERLRDPEAEIDLQSLRYIISAVTLNR